MHHRHMHTHAHVNTLLYLILYALTQSRLPFSSWWGPRKRNNCGESLNFISFRKTLIIEMNITTPEPIITTLWNIPRALAAGTVLQGNSCLVWLSQAEEVAPSWEPVVLCPCLGYNVMSTEINSLQNLTSPLLISTPEPCKPRVLCMQDLTPHTVIPNCNGLSTVSHHVLSP